MILDKTLAAGDVIVLDGATGIESARQGRVLKTGKAGPNSSARCPYPAYAAMRERDTVHRSLLVNAGQFTRHADIDAILRDQRRFSSDPRQGTLTPGSAGSCPRPRSSRCCSWTRRTTGGCGRW